jgi:predicted Rossmann fold flavoprotein
VPTHLESCDIAIIGAGAAGLMAAIAAGRQSLALNQSLRILALDSAKKLGAKILVAGGGRCNVTHHAVDESAYAGSTRPAIRKVLGRFTVADTIQFFRDRGVELKREDTGKLFPTTDNAHTILDALLRAAADARIDLRHPCRVESIQRTDAGFLISSPAPLDQHSSILASRIILATGGLSLPKTGSDGHGYTIAKSLGHTITRTLPALVPLTLPQSHFLTQLSGISLPATLELRTATSPSGKKLASFTDSTLLTHFGLSGPSVLDISRYYLDAVCDPEMGPHAAQLALNFLPHRTAASLDSALLAAARSTPTLSIARAISDPGKPPLPERLARALCEHAGLDPSAPLHKLTRETRRTLVVTATELTLPITGSRGYTHAEVTAGGIRLSEIHLETMESRLCPGLHLCGEICDVDGRIGGFNFQWAWASGHIAGTAAARCMAHP